MQRLMVAAAALLSTLSVYSKTAYVSPSGSNTAPYDSPATAATDANVALATLGEGDELVICEGTNEITSQLVVDRNITIRGTDRKSSILKGKSCRVLHLSSACTVSNLTVSGGSVASSSGGGVRIDGAGVRFVDCIVEDCSVDGWDGKSQGGGIALMAASLVDRCIVRNCRQGGEWHQVARNSKGGGIYATAGVIRNSLLIGNKSINDGGNAYLGGTARMENCTLTKGKAIAGSSEATPTYVSGLRVADSATVVNCICYGNDGDAARGVKVATEDNVSYCCFPAEIGAHCVTDAPLFVDVESGDCSLQPNSPCRDAGEPETVIEEGATDLAGNPRKSGGTVIDIGCYEFDATQRLVEFVVSAESMFVGETLTCTAYTQGVDDWTHTWTVTDADSGAEVATGEGKVFGFATSVAGVLTVKLTVSKSGEDPIELVKPRITTALPEKVYVSRTGTGVSPYSTPETAAVNAQDAVAILQDGMTLVFCEGENEITGQLVIGKKVTICGEDREKSIVRRTTGQGRLFLVNSAAVISNLTIRGGGYPNDSGEIGGGVKLAATGAKLVDCVVVGASGGWHTVGAGIAMTADACIERCVVSNCTAGAMNASCRGYAGGLYATAGTIRNSLFRNNKGSGTGSVTLEGTARMENCTVVGGTSTKATGGIAVGSSARLVNTISWGNTCAGGAAQVSGTAAKVSYCCCPTEIGDHCKTGDPMFIGAANGDYALQAASSCLNAGDPATVVEDGATDLAGNPRKSGGTVIDIGCYEYDSTQVSLDFQVPEWGRPNVPVTLTAVQSGLDDATFNWTVTDVGHQFETTATGEEFVFTPPTEGGTYTVKLEAMRGGVAVKEKVRENVYRAVPLTVYVSLNGGNVAPYGSPEAAATNALDAVAVMEEGTTLVLGVGEHCVTQALTLAKSVTVRGVDRLGSVLRMTKSGGSDTRAILMDSASVVSNLTITGGGVKEGSASGHGVRIQKAGAKLVDCVICGCGYSGSWHTSGGGIGMSADGLIERCVISNCVCGSTFNCRSIGGGISASAGTIRNSLIVGNTCCASGGNVYLSGTARMENCTVSGGHGYEGPGGITVGDSARIVNSISWGNTAGQKCSAGYVDVSAAAANVSYCCCPVEKGSHCVTGDPRFKNVAKGDWRLQASSPCVNAGDPATVIAEGQTDLAGAKRVSGRIVDLGCYERAASGLILLFQ